MKQVHIIGGTGRIGQLLVEILKKEKIDLSLYVRSKEKARSLGFGNITLTEGNVLNTDALSEAIKGKDYNETYYIQHEGEALHANGVDRIAVARLIADLINRSMETSIGVTN